MRPLFGKTISTLLCGLILMGQSAAWLHVATCGGDHGDAGGCAAVETASVSDPIGHSHGCAHHHAHVAKAVPNAESSESSGDEHDHPPCEGSHSHDSDRCAVCQSLFSAAGVVASERSVPTANLAVYQNCLGEAPSAASQCNALPRLRGPPIG